MISKQILELTQAIHTLTKAVGGPVAKPAGDLITATIELHWTRSDSVMSSCAT